MFVALAVECFGQDRWLGGFGVTYCSYVSNPGLNVNVTYRVGRNLYVGPDFSALLTSEREENGRMVKRKELEYNFNVHRLFDVNETLAIYPLTGLNYSKITIHPAGDEPHTRYISTLNAGGGFEFKLKEVRFFFETKYVLNPSKVDLTCGVVFRI